MLLKHGSIKTSFCPKRCVSLYFLPTRSLTSTRLEKKIPCKVVHFFCAEQPPLPNQRCYAKRRNHQRPIATSLPWNASIFPFLPMTFSGTINISAFKRNTGSGRYFSSRLDDHEKKTTFGPGGNNLRENASQRGITLLIFFWIMSILLKVLGSIFLVS